MRVGIFLEGTYPYVTGGVSAWLQNLMENLPDIEFDIYLLRPDSEKKEFKYNIPSNVVAIHEINIFSELSWKRMRPASPKVLQDIFDSIVFNQSILGMAEDLLNTLKRCAGQNLYGLLKTKEFWDILVEIYNRFFKGEGFTHFYWMIKNALLPFVNSFQFVPDRCDVYHSITTGYASLSALAGKILYNTPLIITEHGIYHREREKEILSSKEIPEKYKKIWIGFFKVISAMAYKAADKLTTLFEKNQLFQMELGADPEKVLIIPNGIDVEKFSLPRKEHEGFNIGFVGRIARIKDLKTAIKAFRIVKEKIESSRFLLIGPLQEDEEDYYKECIDLVEVLNLKDSVKFLGPQDVREYYPILDVLLLSSVSEGQPLVVLEAMAAGVPVVATNVGACPEMIRDGELKSGFIVEPKDYVGMAKAVIKLYEDKDLREKFSQSGRLIVEKRYRLENMIARYRKLYEEVLY